MNNNSTVASDIKKEQARRKRLDARIKKETEHHLALVLYDIGKDVSKRTLPCYPSVEKGVELEIMRIENAMSAFLFSIEYSGDDHE